MTAFDVTSLLGHRFGHLTVLGRDIGRGNRKDVWWSVRCDCGTEFAALAGRLRRGVTTSCGCQGGRAVSRLGAHTDREEPARSRARNPWYDPRFLPRTPPQVRKHASDRIARIIAVVDRVPRGKLE
jgi:hypothetical protein